jgi:predicted AlkP superfamily pyrophosphatase or phosphodiesterase
VATGVWPDKHRVMHNNGFGAAEYARYPDFLTRAAALRPELSTAAFLSWRSLHRHGTFGSGAGVRLLGDGDRDGYGGADRAVAAAAARCLAEEGADAVFVYLGATDEAAHDQGPHSAAYREALLAQDGHLGRLLDAIRARPGRADERWTVLVTTDHGHRDEGGHGGVTDAEREVFVVLAEPGADLGGALLARPRLVDIAPTVLDRLGIPADPGWALDGEALPRPRRS